MKANFKPLVLATAVAAITAGYTGVTNAQIGEPEPEPGVPGGFLLSNNDLGDVAIIPYYTVQEEWGTGMHIINTSDMTQVVKLRFRRGSDSLDALDLNLILSPEDEWTGFLNDSDGTIRLSTQDTTCTAPLPSDGGWDMPALYREGADEGYIEVIAMGAVRDWRIGVGVGDVGEVFNSLAYNAEHVGGVPRNCAYVEQNFLDGDIDTPAGPVGVLDADVTRGPYDNASTGAKELGFTNYIDGGNALKVSWFIRDADTGIEFGDDAAHIQNFQLVVPMMTNQEFGVFSGDLGGFDFPDLNGGSPQYNRNGIGPGLTPSHKYNALRVSFGVTSIINDWSNNPELNVGTDWMVTIPGQYVMLDLPEYLLKDVDEDGDGEADNPCLPAASGTDGCDMRDIPVRAAFEVWDREEALVTDESGRGIVVSPSIPGLIPTTELRFETNVIHWGDRPVVDSMYSIVVDTSALDQVSGWARLGVTSKSSFGSSSQGICYWTVDRYDPRPGAPGDPNDLMNCASPAVGDVPMVGFVAWERSFPDNPDGNYGRAVRHSFDQRSLPINP